MAKVKKRDSKQKDLPLGGRLFELLKNIVRLQSSEFFRVPVDAVKYNCLNYYEVIKRPMDLYTMKTKLLDGLYTTLADFEADFQLIIENCVFYNPNAEHAVRKSCDKFNISFYNKFNRIKEDYGPDAVVQVRGLEEMEQKEIDFQKRKMIDLQPEFIQRPSTYELGTGDQVVKKIKLSCSNNKITINAEGSHAETQRQPTREEMQRETSQSLQEEERELQRKILKKKQQQQQQIEEKQQQLMQLIKEQELQQKIEKEKELVEEELGDQSGVQPAASSVCESKPNTPSLPPTTPSKPEAPPEQVKEEQPNVTYGLEIKAIQQSSLQYYSSRIEKYYKLCLKKVKQINEFLINIQDNFESLNFLIESSQTAYSFEELNKVWVLVSQLVMWFSHHRSNLDTFTVKNNNKQFYKFVTQLAKSLRKILKYQIRAGHTVYRLNKEAYQLDLQDFQAILDMEARQNNIKLSIPQEVRQQMYLSKQMKSSLYHDHALLGQAKFNKPLKYIEDRNKNRKILLEKMRNQQNLIDQNKSKLTQSINTFNQDLVNHKNTLYMKINRQGCPLEEGSPPKQLPLPQQDYLLEEGPQVEFELKAKERQEEKAPLCAAFGSEESMEVESEETCLAEDLRKESFNEYRMEDVGQLGKHDLLLIDCSARLVVPAKLKKSLEQKGLQLGGLSLEKIIFSSLFGQVKITQRQKNKVQHFIDTVNTTNQGRTRLLFRDQLLKGFINQNGQLFEKVLKFQELVYFRVRVSLERLSAGHPPAQLDLKLTNCLRFELAQEFQNLSSCGQKYVENRIKEFGGSLTRSQLYSNFVLMLIYRQLQEILVSNLSYCESLNCYYSFDFVAPGPGSKNPESQLYLTICATYSDIEQLSIHLNDLSIFDVPF